MPGRGPFSVTRAADDLRQQDAGHSPLRSPAAPGDDRSVNTSTAVETTRVPATSRDPAPCDLLAVAGDPVRWRLLSALAAGPRCVCQLQPIAAVSAPALSHHLRVLREAGLVTAARRGRWIDYTLTPTAAARLHAALPVPAAHDHHGSAEHPQPTPGGGT